MNTSCLLCGVGGQGTILAAKLIAYAAMKNGFDVRTSETIGMAQRGGCVVSHVRTGHKIASPIIPMGGADVIIAFEPGEAVRCLPYLKKGGTLIVNSTGIQPVTASLGMSDYRSETAVEYLKENVTSLHVIDGEAVCRTCGSPRVLNIALLAAAAKSGALNISVDDLKTAILERVNEKFHTVNLKAVDTVCSLIP